MIFLHTHKSCLCVRFTVAATVTAEIYLAGVTFNASDPVFDFFQCLLMKRLPFSGPADLLDPFLLHQGTYLFSCLFEMFCLDHITCTRFQAKTFQHIRELFAHSILQSVQILFCGFFPDEFILVSNGFYFCTVNKYCRFRKGNLAHVHKNPGHLRENLVLTFGKML